MRLKPVQNIIICWLLIFIIILSPDILQAKGERNSSSSHSSGRYLGSHTSKRYSGKSYSSKSSSKKSGYSQHTSKAAYGVQRNSRGRIKRSSAAKHDFMKQTGYPNGRPGYVVDHILPLKRGGKDEPNNMQWQTKADAKAKDKWE